MGYDGSVTIRALVETKSFDAQIEYIEKQLEEIEYKLKQADMGFEVGDVAKLEAQYEKLTNQLSKLKQKQADLNKTDLTEVQKNIDKVGNSVNKTISKVGKWALAVFGIRSAYMAVRNAIDVISSDDEQLKTDIEYMKNALAYTLEPIVRKIVDLAKQLMFYVGYITKAWTGRNIFENANKSLANANKNAQKLSKTMAGFDEMNVLSDNSSNSGGVGTPSFDLSAPEDIKPPAWIEFIAQNKDVILATLGGIASALVSIKFGLTLIEASSVFLIVSGAILLVQTLIDYLGDLDGSLLNNGTSWEKLGKILASIAIILGGVALAIASVPVAIAAAVVAALSLLMSLWNKITELWENGKAFLDKIADNLMNKGFILGAVLIDIFRNSIDSIFEIFNGLFKGIKGIFDGILLLFKGDFKNGFINIAKGIANLIFGILNSGISAINAIISPVRGLIVAFGKVTGKNWTMDNIKIPKIPYLAVGGIVNMPSRGVPIGGAIAGESGAEGVIPLTDSQAMETLGATIGKYITINANITNTMNGRVISRELQKINTNNDFAMNR